MSDIGLSELLRSEGQVLLGEIEPKENGKWLCSCGRSFGRSQGLGKHCEHTGHERLTPLVGKARNTGSARKTRKCPAGCGRTIRTDYLRRHCQNVHSNFDFDTWAKEAGYRVMSKKGQSKPTPRRSILDPTWTAEEIVAGTVRTLWSDEKIPVKALPSLIAWHKDTERFISEVTGLL
jgi:hypothetical protein